MKKQIILLSMLLMGAATLFSQTSDDDLRIFQQYFGSEKMGLTKEYMKLTHVQDSLFWPIYEKYENERLALGRQRLSLVEEYLSSVQEGSGAKAQEMVNKGVAIEINFKNLQKKYFTEMSKKIGPIKAAQFYQLENYLNNVINLSIQESIPFIGELEQKHENIKK
jgi:hypothetical protein